MKQYLLLLSLFSGIASAQSAQNIWLFDIEPGESARVLNSQKITDNNAYSNQPHFIQGEDALFYTQAIQANNEEQMETMRYDIASGSTVNLTQSSTSEYSPTPYSGGFSTILVDESGKQWLWAFDNNGKSVGKLSHAEPIGYHVWLNDNAALAFVLGEPHSLQRLTLGGEVTKIDENIGASLWAIPQSTLFSYSKLQNDSVLLMAYDPHNKTRQQLTALPKDTTYYAWLPDGNAVTATESVVLRWSPKVKPDSWEAWLDLGAYCNSISRLHARELTGRIQLAVVCNDI